LGAGLREECADFSLEGGWLFGAAGVLFFFRADVFCGAAFEVFFFAVFIFVVFMAMRQLFEEV